MQQYSIAEAKNKLPALVRVVEEEGSVELTRWGKSIAVIVSMDEYQRLQAQKTTFWDALVKFREAFDLEDVNIEPEIFEGLRDQSPGREVVL
jgi:prevent-host-death family protein